MELPVATVRRGLAAHGCDLSQVTTCEDLEAPIREVAARLSSGEPTVGCRGEVVDLEPDEFATKLRAAAQMGGMPGTGPGVGRTPTPTTEGRKRPKLPYIVGGLGVLVLLGIGVWAMVGE